MNDEPLRLEAAGLSVPLYRHHSLVLGSGAAGLAAADRLHQFGVRDVAVVSEDLAGGTSRNTGSDKQTYYKLSTSTRQPDSPYDMARALFAGGAMHGDIALIEALGSAEAFYHLVSIGVDFPMNSYGGFVGYKTDHDPLQRGTSIGPYTSQVMVERLLSEVRRRGLPIYDRHYIISLITMPASGGRRRAAGALALDTRRLQDEDFGLRVFLADNVVFALGGPGGLYEASVYPAVHTGSIGLALEAGAEAVNLGESQFGLASTGFRWNVSGTYQQAMPRYISIAADGSQEREFLAPFFSTTEQMAGAVFLKGYQWPFDPRKLDGSSLIDLLVYRERILLGRRVFMDFRTDPGGRLAMDRLPREAAEYLEKSDALLPGPYERLVRMNPLAVDLYRRNGIDLEREPLEIDLCAQHNNGGLAADIWWESLTVERLFPVGEVNGTHGVYRPGGSALNSGQVGALRLARKISGAYAARDLDEEAARRAAGAEVVRMLAIIDGLTGAPQRLAAGGGDGAADGAYRREFQRRMTEHGAAIRDPRSIGQAAADALRQASGFGAHRRCDRPGLLAALADRQMALAHAAYLSAIQAYLEAGGGSRGSALVLDPHGLAIHERLGAEWRYRPEDLSLRRRMLCTRCRGNVGFEHRFVDARPIPESDYWFEDVWREFRAGRYLQSRW